jgi:energy-coupling factor transporter ATP-binding protein EcfA2
MRTDQAGKGRVLTQTKEPGADRWGLTATAGAELAQTSSTDRKTCPVNLAALAIWLGREVNVSTLPPRVLDRLTEGADDVDRLLAWFNSEFSPSCGDLVGTIYENAVPSEFRGHPFAPNPVDESTYQTLGSLPPAPTYSGNMSDLVSAIEGHVRTSGFSTSDGLVQRVFTAWLNGDIVVLVGQPGTGKSTFAGLIAAACEEHLGTDHALVVSVRADFDEAELIGYERLDGTAQLRDFSNEVLDSAENLSAHIVILEEFNLSAVENYLASVLVATQDAERLIRLPSGEPARLPVDAFIIATCNSYRDEPDTRMRVSAPAKRRSSIISMPNVLAERYDRDGVPSILEFAVEMVRNELERVEARLSTNRGSQFDALRSSALATVGEVDDLSLEVRDHLGAICQALLDTATGASWFTAGLLRDVALTIAHAQRSPEAELIALGDAVASKIVHQMRGTHSDIQDFRAAVVGLPNAAEIIDLTDRMMDGPSDELIPVL